MFSAPNYEDTLEYLLVYLNRSTYKIITPQIKKYYCWLLKFFEISTVTEFNLNRSLYKTVSISLT